MTKLDLHIHSCYSKNLFGTRLFGPPSRSRPEDILKEARKKGISVLAVTDHDNIKGSLKTLKIAKRYDIITLPAVEIGSKDGDIIALDVKNTIPRGLTAEETLDLIEYQGGYAIAPHPFNPKFSLSKKKLTKNLRRFNAIEVYNSHSLSNGKAKKFAFENNMSMVAGSDSHYLKEIGNAYCTTEETIENSDQLIDCILKGKLEPHLKKKSSYVLNLAPQMMYGFLYWKKKQLAEKFNKDVKLPYKD